MKMLTMHRAASTAQAQHDLIRHRAEGRIQYAATIPLSDAMTWVGSNLGGLDRDEAAHSEADNGRNVVTRGKNPFAPSGEQEGTVPYVKYQQDL